MKFACCVLQFLLSVTVDHAVDILLRNPADLLPLTFVLFLRSCRSWILKVCSVVRSWRSWILSDFAMGSCRSWILTFYFVFGSCGSRILIFGCGTCLLLGFGIVRRTRSFVGSTAGCISGPAATARCTVGQIAI